jgi:hypothetical protein
MQSTWAEMQSAFAAAVLDARLPPPAWVIECGGSGTRGGFAVYRNNSLVTLIDALEERFPVTWTLVGEEFFRAMARSYATKHRPRTPLLMKYGDDFPAFIQGFSPAGDVPYLSDIARLEAAWSEAYHAREATPLQSQVLADCRPEELLEMRLMLHPSARILRSAYPVAEIWAAHQHSGAVTPPAHWDAQDVLIVRPDADVCVSTLGPGDCEFISALSEGRCVQEAAGLALLRNAEFDAGDKLVNLFRFGLVTGLSAHNAQETAP